MILDGYTSALPCDEIARRLPGRTPASVAARARRLELAGYARRWSPLEDRRLTHLNSRGITLETIAQQLGRTPEAIRRRAAHLGIDPPPAAPAPRTAQRWTAEEDDLLRLHHALNPARLAELLGRSDGAVCRRLCRLGLRAGARRSPHHPGGRRPAGLDRRTYPVAGSLNGGGQSSDGPALRSTPRNRATVRSGARSASQWRDGAKRAALRQASAGGASP